ncbi:ABC transporter ATP-binding protein [Microcoleus vaginatus]|uniref:ABC transporter ATP-binding protein n=1 Tax=Microcoleus vaginatus TaxID=119532 RepID=UPI001682CD7A|nr:ABC transporter ATP-binding protein [Microcoleus sp. FACHB-84]MBD2008823.1 ABC transporter ATP-binding protein [Microcoleus sp. FACHB-45]
MVVTRRKILSYLLPYRWQFLWALIQVFLISGCELMKPWPFKVIIDNVLSKNPLPWQFVASMSPQVLLLCSCVGIVLIYLLSASFTLLNSYTTVQVGQSMVNDLRGDLYSHLQRLSLALHGRWPTGDLLYRIISDTYTIQTLSTSGFLPILSALILVGGMFIILLRLDALLTLLALSVCPALLILLSPLNVRITSAATHARRQESAVYSLVQTAMSSMRVIQAFTKEEEEYRKFMAASQGSLDANLHFYVLQTLYGAVIRVVIGVWGALVIGVGASHVLEGTLTVGELVIFISYLTFLLLSLSKISETWGLIKGAKVGVGRVFEILEMEHALQDGLRVFPSTGAKGEIAWREVCFEYLPNQPVLKQINLCVPAGKKVAIVGATGGGKSTLVSLLPRFYDPQSGQVTIDGVDIREFQLKSLRSQIGMVLQPPLVFPTTMRENIAYGRSEATLEEIISAAQLACIHDFIAQLPQGYDTVVGEQGATLSEGQKQRLTIARAILRNAPILILDEPTSSMDTETEAILMEGLERLMAEKTTFIIAHRLSTVRQADLIVVLRAGEIVEQGTFAELMRHSGAFASLYRTQFRTQVEKTTP